MKSAHQRISIEGGRYRIAHSAPLYVNALRSGARIHAFASDQGGGIRGGERHATEIAVGAGAQLAWRPVAATLVFPGGGLLRDTPCEISCDVSVAAGSLTLWGKPIIFCTGSRTRLRTSIDVVPGADLAFLEIFACGRSAYGERWRMASLENSFHFTIAGAPIYSERWTIDDRRIPLGRAGLNDCELAAWALFYGPRAQTRAQALADFYATGFAASVDCEISFIAEDTWALRALDAHGLSLGRPL